MPEINIENYKNLYIDLAPDTCPWCYNKIVPFYYAITYRGSYMLADLACQCPNNACNRMFVAFYYFNGSKYIYSGTNIGNTTHKEFDTQINNLSPDFVNIYNESFCAEQYKLNEIAGVGYRKSLEFLIKDFAIYINSNDKEKILNMNLSSCIEKYIEDTNTKNVAKRAAWLGNDETHYIRKWIDKDISDLKRLIEVAIHGITGIMIAQEIIKDMPEPQKN